MHRLFVAFPLPNALAEPLTDLMEGVPELRWEAEERLHLTIRFIGEVERPVAEDLAAALLALRPEPVAIALSGLGRFDRRGGGVLWAGVSPKAPLQALAAKVDRACHSAGLAPERRAFHPHISLARWSGRPPAALSLWLDRHAGLTSPAAPLGPLTLFESHLGSQGAHHEAILTL